MHAALLLAFLAGCASGVRIDSSPQALASGDLTLIHSLSNGPCSSLPAQGADVCRFIEGTPIESSWRLVLPSGKFVSGGEVTVYWKDIQKTFAVTGPVLEIPLRDLMGHDTWDSDDTDAATALAQIKVKAVDGTERQILAEGLAVIIVLKPGYSPLPISSSDQAFGGDCALSYTTSGRTSLSCEVK